MIRHFCDKCNTEVNKKNQFEDKDFKVAQHAIKLSWSGPQSTTAALCKQCVIHTLKETLET